MSDTLLGTIAGFVFGFFIGVCVAGPSVGERFRTEAIEHGAAHYDTVTGEWRWNDDN